MFPLSATGCEFIPRHLTGRGRRYRCIADASTFRKACIANPLLRVRDGDEAISYLAGEGIYADRDTYPLPVLLLLDLKMPRRNGFDVLSWIREQPDLQRLPVTVLTSSGEDRDVEKAYGLGASSYLQKPSEFLDLIEALKSLKNYWRIVEKPAA